MAVVGTFLDEKVPLGRGFTSTLRDVVRAFNFGVVQVAPTGTGAEISLADPVMLICTARFVEMGHHSWTRAGVCGESDAWSGEH